MCLSEPDLLNIGWLYMNIMEHSIKMKCFSWSSDKNDISLRFYMASYNHFKYFVCCFHCCCGMLQPVVGVSFSDSCWLSDWGHWLWLNGLNPLVCQPVEYFTKTRSFVVHWSDFYSSMLHLVILIFKWVWSKTLFEKKVKIKHDGPSILEMSLGKKTGKKFHVVFCITSC